VVELTGKPEWMASNLICGVKHLPTPLDSRDLTAPTWGGGCARGTSRTSESWERLPDDLEEFRGTIAVELEGLTYLLLRLPTVRAICAELQQVAFRTADAQVATLNHRGMSPRGRLDLKELANPSHASLCTEQRPKVMRHNASSPGKGRSASTQSITQKKASESHSGRLRGRRSRTHCLSITDRRGVPVAWSTSPDGALATQRIPPGIRAESKRL
jgi:hypothetical protein